MMSKTLKDFGFYFFAAFFTYSMFTLFITDSFLDDSWEFIFLSQKLTSLPLIIDLFLFSTGSALVLMMHFKFKERKKTHKIENALKMLNEGQYSADIFLQMFSDETPAQVNRRIDREFLKLHEKIMVLSEEAVSTVQQAAAISEETREEIIEGERHRIARELHDSVSQQLFAAAMLISALQEHEHSWPEMTQKQISLIETIINDAQSEMRALLLHLRPIKLDGKSLKEGIEQLLSELKTKVAITVTYDIEDIKLTEVVEDHLFRIVQELLSNILRHSHAKELEIYLKKTDNFYQLRVVDDGVGFDLAEKKTSGFGLRNIQERIAGLGGHIRIISFPKQGTSLEIRIPLVTGG